MTSEQLEELTAWARKLEAESDAKDIRAAARARSSCSRTRSRVSAGQRPAPPTTTLLRHRAARRARSPTGCALDVGSTRIPSASRAGSSRTQLEFVARPHESIRPTPSATRSLPRASQGARTNVGAAVASARDSLAFGLPVVALTAATYGGAARIAAPDIEAHGPEDDHIGAPPSCHGLRSGRAPTRARSIGSAGRSTDSTSRRGQRTLATVLSSTRGAFGDGAHTVSVAANGPFPAPAERRPGTSPSTRNLPTSALRRRRFRRGVRSVCPGG